MSKLSITHLNSYFIASPLHSELISALDRLGIKQNVFVPVQKASLISKNLPDELQAGHIYYIHCFGTIHRYLWPLKMLRIWRAFKKHYEKNPTPLIHAHTLIVNGLIAYWAHNKWGVPYVVTIRNTDLNLFLNRIPFFRALGLKVLNHADQIITISPAYRDNQMTRFFTKDKHLSIYEKCVIIPNGIHDFWIRNQQQKQQRQTIPAIVFSGRMDRNKNLDALLTACESLSGSGFALTLNILGDGPLLSGFKARQYGFPVKFYGHLSKKEQILEVLRKSDVLVVPSFNESFGLVYPEAMSQSLPVIYTRGQGFDGHFPDGYVGFSVNPYDADEIAEKIKLVFADYDRLSSNAHNLAPEFSWENVTGKLIKIYNAIIKD
ncbi:MAG: glycosyltransferase family 4 protein [Prolixibacteraceae bacterium]|nr:glycosyltransferase family 4 protein [Prolixibacteraceae bacterium]